MNLRKLVMTDKNDLEELVNTIEENLPNKDWWLPVSENTRKNFFNEKTTCFMGFEDNGKIVAACGLFFDEEEYKEEIEAINLTESLKVAEIGRCMVSTDYRGQGLMVKINDALIEEAKQKNVDVIVATAHPDNTPSNRSFIKSGFEKCATKVLWGDYLRNIYMKKL